MNRVSPSGAIRSRGTPGSAVEPGLSKVRILGTPLCTDQVPCER